MCYVLRLSKGQERDHASLVATILVMVAFF